MFRPALIPAMRGAVFVEKLIHRLIGRWLMAAMTGHSAI
jgi:hypothetical protein